MTEEKSKKSSILCIFTATGATYTFRDVEIVLNNETNLVFQYRAMSDGRLKTATFFRNRIVGFSVTEFGI